jgi:hypothetical protein
MREALGRCRTVGVYPVQLVGRVVTAQVEVSRVEAKVDAGVAGGPVVVRVAGHGWSGVVGVTKPQPGDMLLLESRRDIVEKGRPNPSGRSLPLLWSPVRIFLLPGVPLAGGHVTERMTPVARPPARAADPRERQLYERLAEGKSPHCLLITCSDSRLVPSVLLQAKPGEFFVCRNAGNIMPLTVTLREACQRRSKTSCSCSR